MSNPLKRPPLTGREDQIRFLTKHLEAANAGKGSLVLVSGEAGIGKSRLLEELSEQAKAKGFKVLTGNCVPGIGAAYLPFQEIVEDYFGLNREGKTSRSKRLIHSVKRSGPEIAGAVPMVGGVLKLTATLFKEYHASKSDKSTPEFERTFSAMLDFLREASNHGPLLVLLDDLQWADSASIQMLHFLARNSVGLKIVLLGTYRPEELQRETERREHPLLDSLRIMRREGICEELSLDTLNADNTRLVIQGMLGGTISDDLLQRIVKESGGNPLFTIETIRLLVDTYAITLQDGRWEEKQRGETISIPSSVLEVIRRRLDELPEKTRRELSYASVLGEVFEPSTLAEMLGTERIQALEDLDSVERRFQLVKPFEGAYRFSHEKVRRVLYDEIPTELQKEIHRKAGMILEKRLPDNSLNNELSLHFCKAGDEPRCIKYSLLSAQDSLGKFALQEAVRYFGKVILTTKDNQLFLQDHLVALEGRGDAQQDLGFVDQALENYIEYVRLCRTPADSVRVLRKSAQIDYSANRLTNLSKAEEYGDIDKVETARLKKIRAEIAEASGQSDTAERIYTEAARVFEETQSDVDLANTLVYLQYMQLARADTRAALETSNILSELAKRIDHPRILRLIAHGNGWCYVETGQIDLALNEANRCLEISSKFGYEKAAINSYEMLVAIHELAGDFQSASQTARKAYELARNLQDVLWSSNPTIDYAHTCVHMRRIAQAEELSEEVSKTFAASGVRLSSAENASRGEIYLDSGIQAFALSFRLLQAELKAAKGNLAESQRDFARAIELLRHSGTFYNKAKARQHYAECVLLPAGLKSEAKEALEAALKLWEKLGNNTQAERTRKSLARIA